MFCPVCATTNPVAAGHCLGCGGRLPRPARPRTERWRRPRPWRALILGVAPLLALLAVFASFYRAEEAGLAAWYDHAEAALAAGDYEDALDAFAAAGTYHDAADRRTALAATLAPAQDAYLHGAAALAAGDPVAAIDLLLPVVRALPHYADGAALLAEARRQRAAELAGRADAAVARRDWLTAEQALVALVAADPGDSAAAARLVALRRDHAPLVFAREHALYLVGPDGADERLLTDEVSANRPVWSPDRSRLAFVAPDPNNHDAPGQLYVIGADGRDLTRLSATAHRNALPAWSPDGGRVAYTSVATWDADRGVGLLTIHVVDLATGVDRDVTGVTARHAMTPSWAPDGDRLAFISRRPPARATQSATSGPGDVYVLTLSSGQIVDLTEGQIPDVVRVSWSPRADRLLCYAYDEVTGAGTAGSGVHLYTLDLPAGPPTLLASAIEAPTDAWSPAWSPDGDRLAWIDGRAVVVREANGEETRVETDAFVSGALTWSPDGRALLAVAADPNQSSLIVDFGADEPTLTPLQIVYDTIWPTGTPQWSPTIPAVPPAPPSVAGTGLDRAFDRSP